MRGERTSTKRVAFVVMPIKKAGSPDYEHFRALFDEILKPTLEAAGFSTQRADDVQKTGAITKDIILRLAEAHLVIADLTDLNPNVFYELGVRHALRGFGTVMILDDLRTADVPFDLSAYRVIRFKGELTGLGRLRADLATYARLSGAAEGDTRDNPVHDWLPVLPANSLEAASGTAEGELRKQLATATKVIRQYEKMVGTLGKTTEVPSTPPLEVVIGALQDAADGNLSSDLMDKAQETTERRDRRGFLNVTRQVIERANIHLQAQEFLRLAGMAQVLGLEQAIVGSILAHGLSIHPNDEELKRSKLSLLAHSSDGRDRQRARDELARIVGMNITEHEVVPPNEVNDDQLQLLGVMLDALHADGLHAEALRIAGAFAKKFPARTIVCRNMARALKECGHDDASWTWYKYGVCAPDASEISAVWYGNSLHNVERHVDAAEAYLVACKLHPDDGVNFSHVAEELALAWADGIAGNTKGRVLPTSIDVPGVIAQLGAAAYSCPRIDAECIARCRRAARRSEVDMHDAEVLLRTHRTDEQGVVAVEVDVGREGVGGQVPSVRRMGIAQRVELARSLYAILKSEVTIPSEDEPSAGGPDPEA